MFKLKNLKICWLVVKIYLNTSVQIEKAPNILVGSKNLEIGATQTQTEIVENVDHH